MWLRDNIEKTVYRGIAFILVLSPVPALAASNTPGAAGAPLFLACAFAYLTRRKAIGGWLFYFYLQLYISLLLWPILFAINIFKYLSPSEWVSSKEYALFLLSTVPLYMSMCAETFFATVLLFRRDIEHVRFVRYSLIILVATASLSLLIDIAQSNQNLVLDAFSLSFAVIWCLYFMRSRRVQMVLVENRWDHDEFSNRFGAPTVESLSRSKRSGWIAAAVTFCFFFVMFYFGQDPPKPLGGVFQGLVWGAIIGALVQHFSKRPKHEKDKPSVKTAESTSAQVSPGVEEVQQHGNNTIHVLNRKQRMVLIVTALFALAALLFPPFVMQLQSGVTLNSGYSFLFSESRAVVNTGLLALELVVVAIVGAIGIFLTKNS